MTDYFSTWFNKFSCRYLTKQAANRSFGVVDPMFLVPVLARGVELVFDGGTDALAHLHKDASLGRVLRVPLASRDEQNCSNV